MKKVYVLGTEHPYEGCTIYGFFSSRERGEAEAQKLGLRFDPDAYDINFLVGYTIDEVMMDCYL